MDDDILNWLLQGPDWLRYAVKRQILQRPGDVLSAVQEPEVQTLLTVLNSSDRGFDAVMAGEASYTRELFLYLFFLADVGFTAEDLGLEAQFARVMTLGDSGHRFLLSKEMRPDYFCISSILLSAMAKMSPKVHDQLYPHLGAIMESQRLDGGWHCARSRAVGKRLQDTESCPMDNLNVLSLLGQYGEYREDPGLIGAIDLLLDHWERKGEKWRPYGFGIGTQFQRLKYPELKYGILRVLDVLSLFPYAVNSGSFQDMLNCVRRKSTDGKYCAESIVKLFSGFDFGQKKAPSRWITFLINRIETRVAAAG